MDCIAAFVLLFQRYKNTQFELKVSFIAIGLDQCFYPKSKNFLDKFEFNVMFIAAGLYRCFCAFIQTVMWLDELYGMMQESKESKMPHNILSINWLPNWQEMLRVVLVQPCALLFLSSEQCEAFLGVVCYLCMFFFY